MKIKRFRFASITFFFLIIFLGNISAQVDEESETIGMNNKKMEAVFKSEVEEMQGELGNWQLLYGEMVLFVLTDEKNNRMRVFTPVIEQKLLEEGQLERMLEANFHSALDSKYSLYEGYVISVYTHPLKELQPDQLIDAMRQVVILSRTFGDAYTSTGLIFGGGKQSEDGEEEEDSKSKKKTKKM